MKNQFQLLKMKNYWVTDWSYWRGLSCGEVWPVFHASYLELVEWTAPESSESIFPLPDDVEEYLCRISREAEKQGERFDINAFTLGFVVAVKIVAPVLLVSDRHHMNCVPKYYSDFLPPWWSLYGVLLKCPNTCSAC